MSITSASTLLTSLDEIKRGAPWLASTPIRECQYKAFNEIQSALEEHQAEGIRPDDRGSYIVQMAMGTGKTGVIALAATCLPEPYKRVLVVVSSDPLRQQLGEEINPNSKADSFWVRTNLSPDDPIIFRTCTGKDIPKHKRSVGRAVTVTTVQSLLSAGGANLRDYYDLILFDEGHRKGADEWDSAIESVNVPSILFTATPYRSDGKPLRASTIFRYTYENARESGLKLLRPVFFQGVDFSKDRRQAIKTLTRQLNEIADDWKPSARRPRLIVRASSKDEVASLVSEFNQEVGIKAVGVHSGFLGKASRTLFSDKKSIPELANVLIHQHMLIEGFDDTDVIMIAFTSICEDGRVFVQQVGRALRWNQKLSEGVRQKALVAYPEKRTAESVWKAFVKYENDPASYAFIGHEFLPTIEAIENDFSQSLYFRPSVEIRRLPKKRKSARELFDAVKEWLENLSDCNLKAHNIFKAKGLPTAIAFMFNRTAKPNFLRTAHFENNKLELLVIVLGKKHCFIHSTIGRLPKELQNYPLCSPEIIANLLPNRGAEVHSVQLRNIADGEGTIRSRAIWAKGSDRHITFSRDGSFAPQNLSWTSGDSLHLETAAFSSSRIALGTQLSFDDFLEWCKDTEQNLKPTGNQRHPLFDRIASRTDETPGDPFLVRIDLPVGSRLATKRKKDLESTGYLFAEIKKGKGMLCSDQSTGGSEIDVSYNADKLRFELAWKDIDAKYFICPNEDEEDWVDLLTWARRSRRFSVLTTNGVVYLNGKMYRQREPNLTHLLGYLQTHACYAAGKCKYEVQPKNTKKTSKGSTLWNPKSVFYAIENEHLLHEQVTTLICDDGKDEWADFIAFDTREDQKRIVLIHAKHGGKKPGLRIDSLQVVIAQAIKNLYLLHTTPSVDDTQRWSNSKHSSGRTRVRRGKITKELLALFSDPHVKREVWVVQPQVQISKLIKEFSKKNIQLAPQHKKLAYLIDQAASLAQGFGATFRLFGS